jgi:hypothetical protein
MNLFHTMEKNQEAVSRYSFIFLCAFVSLWLNSPAQSFQKLYGDSTVNDVGNSILQTRDGGYAIAGTQYNSGNQVESLFLVRTDEDGDTLWTRRITESALKYSGNALVETYDGGFAIACVRGDGVNFAPVLLKIDSSGNLVWNKCYTWQAQEHIKSIVQTPDSGFLLAGYFYDGDMLVYFIRTNAEGDTLWSRCYAKNGFNAQVYSVQITYDGGFVAVGSMQEQFTADVDAFIFKTDSAGNFLWARGFGDTGYEYAQQVQVCSDSGFVIAAVTYSFGAGLADYFLVKTNSLGNLLWSKTYGGASDDRSESVVQTSDGGFLFTGESASNSQGNFDICMVRTNGAGDTVWTKNVGSIQNNEGYSLTLTSDSAFAIAGYYYSVLGNNDLLLMKASASDFLACTETSTTMQVNSPNTRVVNHSMYAIVSTPDVSQPPLIVEDGTEIETLCLTDDVKGRNALDEFLIYPNPVHSILNIELKDNRNLIFQLRVFNMALSEINLPKNYEINKCTVDCSMLIPGIYILEISTEGEVTHRKVIRQ